MSTIKNIWEVDNAWVNSIDRRGIPEELEDYHPHAHEGEDGTNAPYKMKMKCQGPKKYKIVVEIDGRPGNSWHQKAKDLLDNIQLSPDQTVPSRLTANKKTNLHEVIGYNFGDWAYVTLTVDWAEKQDGNQCPYNEYTSTLTWEKEQPTAEDAIISTQTSYTWRD